MMFGRMMLRQQRAFGEPVTRCILSRNAAAVVTSRRGVALVTRPSISTTTTIDKNDAAAVVTSTVGTEPTTRVTTPKRRHHQRTTCRTYHGSEVVALPVRRRRRHGSFRSDDVGRNKDDDDVEEIIVSGNLNDDGDGEDGGGGRIIADRGALGGSVRRNDDAVLQSDDFDAGAKKMIDRIYDALKPLKKFNDPYHLLRGYEAGYGEFLTLDLGPSHGQYNVQIDQDQFVMLFQSPVSGRLAYYLSKNSKPGQWLSVDDDHVFDGLLVRDLIRQINGVPNL